MAASLPIPDHLLPEIFVRLADPADLVRASAACATFRRLGLLTDSSFLRRYRSLHAPLIGFLDRAGFHPALPPHPSASAACAVAAAADFSFALPTSESRYSWVVRDVRDGRVLLDRPGMIYAGQECPVFTELVVCDPLYRRSLLLPPIPDNLATSVEHPLTVDWERRCEPFLAPSVEEDAAGETSFRVIWMAQCRTKVVAFVFSSTTGQWRAVSSLPWRDLLLGMSADVSQSSVFFIRRQFAYGCFYWLMECRDKLLVLDTQRMEFSIADLPPETGRWNRQEITIVEAGDGRPGMFALADATSDLYYTIRQDKGQWQMQKTISLGSGYQHYITGATGRCLLLVRKEDPVSSWGDLECFSLDAKTLQLERVCGLKVQILGARIYTNFPPSLSSPTVSSGIQKGDDEDIVFSYPRIGGFLSSCFTSYKPRSLLPTPPPVKTVLLTKIPNWIRLLPLYVAYDAISSILNTVAPTFVMSGQDSNYIYVQFFAHEHAAAVIDHYDSVESDFRMIWSDFDLILNPQPSA